MKLAVLGYPIKHSLSPRLFQRFAEESGRELSYQALEVKPEDLATTLSQLQAQAYRGVNLTLPLKEKAFEFAHAHGPAALASKSVNMLTFKEDGSMFGENSDGFGLVRDLRVNKGFALKGKRGLILGAGGAVRGILPALLQEGVGELWIANRTLVKAQVLAREFLVNSLSYDEITAQRYDLVIQGTSAALLGGQLNLPNNILNPGALCYDLVYGEAALPFLAWARGQGAEACDGLGMLTEQAAYAFQYWTAL